MKVTMNGNGHRQRPQLGSVIEDNTIFDKQDKLEFLARVQAEVERTGEFNYAPFVDAIESPLLNPHRRRLEEALNKIRQGIFVLETILEEIGDQPMTSDMSEPLAHLAEGTHFLEQFNYHRPLKRSPNFFPWPSFYKRSEFSIKSRLKERLKAIRFYRETLYHLLASERKPHQTKRLKETLATLLTNSHEAAIALSEDSNLFH